MFRIFDLAEGLHSNKAPTLTLVHELLEHLRQVLLQPLLALVIAGVILTVLQHNTPHQITAQNDMDRITYIYNHWKHYFSK